MEQNLASILMSGLQDQASVPRKYSIIKGSTERFF